MRRKRTAEERDKYLSYLQSPEWASKKTQVKLRSKGVCELCKAAPHEATHHLHYRTLYDEDPATDLIGVCDDCHDLLHCRRLPTFAELEDMFNSFFSD